MIFISSFRPFDRDPTGEYARNQLVAKQSWEKVATRIFYFNSFEPRLNSEKTAFVPSEPYPRLIDLFELAARQTQWVAILNADIVIGQNLPIVEARLKAKRGECASSWRFNFDPAVGISSGVYDDNGLDFFCAVPAVWQKAYEFVDERLRLGATFWDTWLLALFSNMFQTHFFNLTKHRLVFHPRHGGRQYGPGVDHREIRVTGDAHMTHCAP